LVLGINEVGDGGVRGLCEWLGSGSSLEFLSLSGCQLSRQAGILIGDMLKNNNVRLKTLLLGYNAEMGPEGVHTIGEALRTNRVLTTLELSNCGLGPGGIAHLASGLCDNVALTTLDVCWNDNGRRTGRAHCQRQSPTHLL
jgi:Ran GTPase-activating protein (RanGAP) involved in mRNA processing and transport